MLLPILSLLNCRWRNSAGNSQTMPSETSSWAADYLASFLSALRCRWLSAFATRQFIDRPFGSTVVAMEPDDGSRAGYG